MKILQNLLSLKMAKSKQNEKTEASLKKQQIFTEEILDNNTENKETVPGKIFVGGLNFESTSEDLYEYFSFYGEILEAVVIRNGRNGQSRGYGFVTMKHPESANKALQNPNPVIDGRMCNLNNAYKNNKKRNFNYNYRKNNSFWYNNDYPVYQTQNYKDAYFYDQPFYAYSSQYMPMNNSMPTCAPYYICIPSFSESELFYFPSPFYFQPENKEWPNKKISWDHNKKIKNFKAQNQKIEQLNNSVQNIKISDQKSEVKPRVNHSVSKSDSGFIENTFQEYYRKLKNNANQTKSDENLSNDRKLKERYLDASSHVRDDFNFDKFKTYDDLTKDPNFLI